MLEKKACTVHCHGYFAHLLRWAYLGFNHKGLESMIHITLLSPLDKKKLKQQTILARHFLSFFGQKRGLAGAIIINPPCVSMQKLAIYSCIHDCVSLLNHKSCHNSPVQ